MPRMRTPGQWLRDNRVRCRMKQAHVAKALGVVVSTVSRWERDHSQMSLAEFRAACLLFEASADAALGTGPGEITFAARRGAQEETTDGDEEEQRVEPQASPSGDDDAQVRGETVGGRAGKSRRRNGRLRGQDRSAEGGAVRARAHRQEPRAASQ